jgi:aspartate kinase
VEKRNSVDIVEKVLPSQTVVMKFGGQVLASATHFDAVADRIIARSLTAKHLVVVVSAMGKTTDQLQSLANSVHEHPPQRDQDLLMSVGERISMSLLAMSLAKKGVMSLSLTAGFSGVITSSHPTGEKIVEVRPGRIESALRKGNIVIVSGFQGTNETGEITTLGNEGPDATAVALGIALDAKVVEFYKDAPGLFSKDPNIHPDARVIPHLSYQQAVDLISQQSERILHKRAVEMAERNRVPLAVLPFDPLIEEKNGGSLIAEQTERRPREKIYEHSFEVECSLCHMTTCEHR